MDMTMVSGGRFVYGKNVRRDKMEADVWRDAPMPAAIRGDGWIPVERTVLPGCDGRSVAWFARGNSVGYMTVQHGEAMDMGSTVTALGTLKGKLIKVIAMTEGMLRLMVRGSRAVYATYSKEGEMSLHGEMPALPWLHFERTEERMLSVGFGTVALSGKSDARGSTLTDEDQARVSSAAHEAYLRLCERALGSGWFMQPVLMRYRLLDAAGSTLLTGPQVLIGSSEGMQCRGEYSMLSTDSLASLSAGSISGLGFRVALKGLMTLPAPWNRLVGRVLVEVSPALDPVDGMALCGTRVDNDGHNTTVHVTLPTGDDTAHRRMLATMLTHVEEMRMHSVCDRPFDSGAAESIDVGVRPPAGIADGAEVSVYPQHPIRDCVSYGFVTDAGEWQVAGGESVERFGGYPVICHATSHSDGVWRALTEVETEDASGNRRRYASTCSGDGASPASLSGMLMFPDASAREMRVSIEHSGKIVSETYPLTPVKEAGCAVYISTDFKDMMPRGTLPSMPVAGESDTTPAVKRNVLTVFAERCLNRVTDRMGWVDGNVVAVSVAPRSSGSWDFSRIRLFVFGDGGTGVATLTAEGRFHSYVPMDRRRVVTAEAICRADYRRGATHFVIAGEDLLQVDRNGVSTLTTGCHGAEKAGWCGRHGEVWLCRGNGVTVRLNPERPTEMIECGWHNPIAGLHQWEGHLLVEENDGTVRDTRTDSAETPEVEIGFRMANPLLKPRRKQVGRLVMDMAAAHFSGTIGMWGDRGTEVPELLSEYAIDGAVNAPLPLTLVAPYRRWLHLRMKGEGKGIALRL